jgi:hypothetical protein
MDPFSRKKNKNSYSAWVHFIPQKRRKKKRPQIKGKRE